MDSEILPKAINFVQEYFAQRHDSGYEFHDIKHTTAVVEAVKKLSDIAGLKSKDFLNITLAAWFHDIGYISNPENHEVESAKIASDFLLTNGAPQEEVEKIEKLILATKIDWQGDDYHSWIIRDADLSHFASDDFFEVNDRLRRENKYRYKVEISDDEWLDNNINFIGAHKYKSKEGKELFGKKKAQHLNTLKSMANHNPEDKLLFDQTTIAHFETTLKNHIELSAIADNKANIMLTVNVIISTVGLPLMFNILKSHSHFLIPIIILSGTCLVSIIYATLCTRPIKMSGRTDLADISTQKSNLFFFGNYYKMSFEDYEKGMIETTSDKALFENAITRNLYQLGISLGKKYIQLRYSYNIFMFGIILTIISFVFILVFN